MNTESFLAGYHEHLLETGQKEGCQASQVPLGPSSEASASLSPTSLPPCPRLEEALTLPLCPYSCPDGFWFVLLGHLETPDSSGHLRGEKDRKGQDSLQRKEVTDSAETGREEHEAKIDQYTEIFKSLAIWAWVRNKKTIPLLYSFPCLPPILTPHYTQAEREREGRRKGRERKEGEREKRGSHKKRTSFCVSIKYLFLA